MAQKKAKQISTYKDAGVDIDLATELLTRVKKKLASTKRPEMLAPIGGFGGLFQIDLTKYKQPVFVSSIDGHDIVNHCVNDIGVQGAEPVFFLDYIGIGKLRSPLYEEILGGIADACKKVGCAVLGGETAEMPGMYGNDFDLVGVINGIVEKDKLITGKNIKPGHVAIALPSNGLHTNGFSLARQVLFHTCRYDVDTELAELNNETIGEALLSRVFHNFALKLLSVAVGSIVYYLVYQVVIWCKVDTDLLKAFSAVVVAIFLAVPYWKRQFTKPTVAAKGGEKNA